MSISNSPPNKRGPFLVILAGTALCWFLFCLFGSFLRWKFWELGIDTAGYSQLFSRFQQGLGWTSTCTVESLEPINYFNYHYHLLLYPLFLLYKFIPHPLCLYVVQHAMHSLGMLMVGLLAYRLSADTVFSFLISLAFLFFPQHMLAQTVFDFSFRHFSLFFIPLAGIAFQERRLSFVGLSLLIMVSGSEDLALTAAFFCISCIFGHPERWKGYLCWVVFFIGYLLLMLKMGMNHHALYWRYPHLQQGFSATCSVFFSDLNFQYLGFLLGPLLCIPLLRPTPWLLACVPGAMQVLLSATLDTHAIGHHHSAAFSATLFLANLFSLMKCGPQVRRLIVSLQILAIICALSLLPAFRIFVKAAHEGVEVRQGSLAPLENLISPTASISSPTNVADHFWKNNLNYLFPFHGADAEWIVVPKKQTVYPNLSLDEIKKWVEQLLREPNCLLVLETSGHLVFHRRGVTGAGKTLD